MFSYVSIELHPSFAPPCENPFPTENNWFNFCYRQTIFRDERVADTEDPIFLQSVQNTSTSIGKNDWNCLQKITVGIGNKPGKWWLSCRGFLTSLYSFRIGALWYKQLWNRWEIVCRYRKSLIIFYPLLKFDN